ncbi:dihydrodipicolinate synthase family protein [Mesorhizobium sp. L48C026A00]|uniref:dihydrodipicolinate synthase family protein n=1 Tax=Mesorhizobium sp. L48C026A00 TaxID=1287182 RepID=UPI0007C829CD
MEFLSGLSAFPITPSDHYGRVDTVALRRLIARLSAAQVNSIGLLGSTGTYMYLSREERRRALAETLDETAGRMPVVVGVAGGTAKGARRDLRRNRRTNAGRGGCGRAAHR